MFLHQCVNFDTYDMYFLICFGCSKLLFSAIIAGAGAGAKAGAQVKVGPDVSLLEHQKMVNNGVGGR